MSLEKTLLLIKQHLNCSTIFASNSFVKLLSSPSSVSDSFVDVNADCSTPKINHGELIIEHHYV